MSLDSKVGEIVGIEKLSDNAQLENDHRLMQESCI